MNNFSNSILEILFSWVRGIYNDIWSMLNGNTGSLFSWLSAHWVSLVCILVIGGVTVDLIVYLLRWNPQQVWRSKSFWGKRPSQEEIVFVNGYENGIDSLQLDSDPLISEYINNQPVFSDYESQLVPDSYNQPIQVHEQPDPEQPVVVRRRRSDRHVRRSKHGHSFHLPNLDFSASGPGAYPAPPVHAREAFHDAVYPSDTPAHWQNNANSTNEQQ